MRRRVAWLALLWAAGSISCSGIQVTTDYDPDMDFSGVRTYAWLDDNSGVVGDQPGVQSLIDRRVRAAVDNTLKAKGIAQVDRMEAKALVTYHLGVESKLDVDTINTGYGYGAGRYGGHYYGVGTETYVREYKEGTLMIDVIDPPSKQLIWRGTGQSRLSKTTTPEQSEARINQAVGEILAGFPPAKKGEAK